MTTSEPTTEIYHVIARMLRESVKESERQGEQNFHCSLALILDTAESFDQAADRLELLEFACNFRANEIETLTARAEQAEKERDAAIADIPKICDTCKHTSDRTATSYGCTNKKCFFVTHDGWIWREQPQD
jgi:hypothetical protein